MYSYFIEQVINSSIVSHAGPPTVSLFSVFNRLTSNVLIRAPSSRFISSDLGMQLRVITLKEKWRFLELNPPFVWQGLSSKRFNFLQQM